MTELDELIAEAELGEEAKRFLESDLGRCILEMAKQEVALAEKALGKIDPKDERGIAVLQNRIWRGESFEQWLLELMANGENAKQVFKQQSEQ